MKISVVCPTIRPAGLIPVYESLKNQTLQDFEFLVEFGFPKQGHDLNAAFNRMLRRAQGELVVFYEDYAKIPSNGLEKFWDAYKQEPDVFWTAPLGKVDDLDNHAEPRWDWRAYSDQVEQVGNSISRVSKWDTWEIDWGAAPLKALKEIGGFDEELDIFWSSDNVNVGLRAELAGYRFKNLFSNPAVVYDHDKFAPHPFRHRFNPEYTAKRLDEFRNGLKLPPLV